MSKRYFELVEGTSSKFWEVWREGASVNTRYGRIGASGQTTIKTEKDEAAAEKLHAKLQPANPRIGMGDDYGASWEETKVTDFETYLATVLKNEANTEKMTRWFQR
ncbi:MAG: WGR domain-containing protein [Archangium sp.]|nr:WGR domain-containing protein [Archangium sp.]